MILALLLLAHFGLAVLLMYLANWVGLIPWRNASQAHWTERARLLWPVFVTARTNVLLLPCTLDLVHRICLPETGGWWIENGIAAFLGALLGCYPLDHQAFPQFSFRNWLHHVVAGWGIRLALYAALIAACLLMPNSFDWQALLIASGYLALHLAIECGFVLKYLRWVRFMVPAESRLQGIVDAVAARMNVHVRATWQLRSIMAQAYAFPTIRHLAFSNRALEILRDDEIASICAHELGHLGESNIVLAGRLLGSLALFPLIFIHPATQQFGRFGVLVPFLGLLLIARLARRLCQRMERRADQIALSEESNAGVYVGALEKLYRTNQTPAVNASDRQTHPHLYDRMLAAGITPDYPRPAKPTGLTPVGWVYAITLGVLLASLWVRF